MNKISVILAACKGEKYIGEQLRSLFAQTRLPDEILIGDDSPDGATKQAIDAVAPECPKHCRLDYRRNPERLGFLQNFLSLAKRAQGDLIFFCDQDDVWLPEKIAILTNDLEKHPDFDVSICDSAFCDSNLIPTGASLFARMKNPEMDILQINSHHAHPIILSNVYFINGHNICMRRRALPIFLAIPPDFTYHDIWITHAFSMIEKIRLVHQILTYYRIHQTNTSGIPKSFSIFKRGFEIFQKSRGADFQEELQRYLACRKTVLSVVPLKEIPKESINFLHKKVAFCKWRFRLHSISLFCRIFCFNRDTINHYRKYTMNWKYSLLRDLFSLN